MELKLSETYKLVHSESLAAEMLEGETDDAQQQGTADPNQTADPNADKEKEPFNWGFIIIIAAVFIMIIAWFFLSGRKNKSGEKEYAESIEAIKPGNKVTSRGGICGIVVEVCDDNTVVLETGSEESGKSRIKLMKECIYETDAKGPTQLAREEAELRRKQEKEAKLAAKNAAKNGGTAEPTEATEEPSEEPTEEQPEEKQE